MFMSLTTSVTVYLVTYDSSWSALAPSFKDTCISVSYRTVFLVADPLNVH